MLFLAYLVELWPYATRSRGIGIQQIFGKLAGFFSNNVNSIAISSIGWRFLAIYCGWIAFEFIVIFLLYPETYNRTLEELAFMFEDDSYNHQTTAAVEKKIHFGDQEEPHTTHVQRTESQDQTDGQAQTSSKV
jgi:sugar transport protein